MNHTARVKGRLAALMLCALFGGTTCAQTLTRVAENDCGVPGAQPFLIMGDNYRMPGLTGSEKALTCSFGSKVIYAFDHVDINADYELEVVYLADSERKQRIVADGNEVQAPVTLEAGKEQRYRFVLPKKAYAYGQLVLVFEALKGPNAIVSELNLYSSNPERPRPFEGERKRDLARTQTYRVDTAVNVEEHLPLYTVRPKQVPGVFRPVVSLDGTWQFCPNPPADFPRNEQAGGQWSPIAVPGEWAMQGFRVDSAAWAGYRTEFILPADWEGRRVKLRFDGVFSESEVYLNGERLGSHLGGMTAFEFDATDYLHAGSNRLALKVKSESLADMLGSLTQYAAHQLGGITRKVTLMAVPEVHLTDLRVVTELDSAYRDAELRLYVGVTNAGPFRADSLSLALTVDGLPVDCRVRIPAVGPGASWSGWVSTRIENPRKWDSEHPNLYTARLSLNDGANPLELVEKRVGFREIEVRGNRLLVNGRPVKLHGVCRHEVHPLTGRVLTPELVRRDAELYRAANCNFVRTSHYPPCEEFIEACDELGLFVELEAPVCWVGHGANANWTHLDYRDSQYYPYILQANMETIHFYRNHPSIIFWSMANESYWNKEFAQVEVYVDKADPTRPHAFHDQAYGGFNNQGSTAQIANIHYPGPDGYKVAAKSERPMTYGEYCHLNVYNRSELVTDPGVRIDWGTLALAPTWENMYRTPGVLGGSVWSGIDDIFQMPDGSAVGYGPWGPIDGWRRTKPEYWDMKKVYSPVRVKTRKLEAEGPFTIEVENRYTFTDLNELTVRWSYGEESGVASVDCAPGDSARFVVPVARSGAAAGLRLEFVDSRGFVADEYLLPVGPQTQNEWPVATALPTRLKEKKDRYVIAGEDFECEVSRSTGQILSLRRGGTAQVVGGPWLMALPLTGGGCYPNHNANTPVFNAVCSQWKVTSVKARREGDDVCVDVEGAYKEFEGRYTLRFNAGGTVQVHYAFTALANVNPRQWGVVFEAPRSFDCLYWRREGFWNVYPADHIGRPEGEASMFYEGAPREANPRVEPTWPWSYDANQLGSNDFRSSRTHIYYAGLKNRDGATVTALSDGSQHWRSWLEGDRVRFLVADFVSPGEEMFLGSYYAPYRKPLKKGDSIEGTVHLQVAEK